MLISFGEKPWASEDLPRVSMSVPNFVEGLHVLCHPFIQLMRAEPLTSSELGARGPAVNQRDEARGLQYIRVH